jgi:hypothetical protein
MLELLIVVVLHAFLLDVVILMGHSTILPHMEYGGVLQRQILRTLGRVTCTTTMPLF